MNIDLSHLNALVCGSTQGIGKAIALNFAKCGAKVTLIARDKAKLKAVLEQMPGDAHHYLVADFQDPDTVARTVKDHIASHGGFHVLVNNTGGPRSGSILEADAGLFELAFRQHLICSHLLTQVTVPFMKTENYGRIINIISTSVKEPIPGLGVSNTIRGAMGNWSKTMANELGPHGITVNNILPGFTKTERLNEIIQIKAKAENVSFETMEHIMKDYSPAKRFAEPNETAKAACFLASAHAAYINGINLPVDGGRTKSL